MPEGLSTALILVAIALLEGIQRVPAGSIVLRRTGAGPWRAVDPLDVGREFAVVASVIPFVLPVVARPVRPSLPALRLVMRVRARGRRVRLAIATLRATGLLSLALLVVGVPLLTARHGAWGLVKSVQALLLVTLLQAVLVHLAMRRAGAGNRDALMASARTIWPFTAPCAADIVQRQVIADAPPLVVARALLGDAGFHAVIRPLAFDVLHGGRNDENAAVLAQLCDRATLAAVVAVEPDELAAQCPRCRAQYMAGVGECADCATPLVPPRGTLAPTHNY